MLNNLYALSAPVLTELLCTLFTYVFIYASVCLFAFMYNDMYAHILCLYNCIALALVKHVVLLFV